jgi:small subunit ribosomal protein S2
MPYVTTRWMGGTLTNFETIKKSLAKFKKYQTMDSNGELAKLPKKEESAVRREMARMTRNFDGIIGLTGLPGAVFVVDVSYEEIAVREAKRMNIASIGLVDTNSDPTILTHPIPGNDDATKSIRIIIDAIVESIQKGLAQRETRHSSNRPADKTEAAPVVPPVAGEVAAPVVADDEVAIGGEKPVAARKRTVRASGAKKSEVSTEDV